MFYETCLPACMLTADLQAPFALGVIQVHFKLLVLTYTAFNCLFQTTLKDAFSISLVSPKLCPE